MPNAERSEIRQGKRETAFTKEARMKPEVRSSSRNRGARSASQDAHGEQPLPNVSSAGAWEYSNGSRIDRIAVRAHEIYQRRGGQNGRALDDWLEAEREIDGEMERSEASQG
jgi:hypothetical protein